MAGPLDGIKVVEKAKNSKILSREPKTSPGSLGRRN
jgi:hypothetical protein